MDYAVDTEDFPTLEDDINSTQTKEPVKQVKVSRWHKVKDAVFNWASTTWQHLNASDRSCYLFYPENPFRLLVVRIIQNPWFGRAVIFIIISNCIILAFDDPGCVEQGICESSSPLPKAAQQALTYFFTGAFTLEIICQSIAKNFAFGPDAYLHSGWNWVDFLVVSVSYISILPLGGSNLSGLRALRALRPLRALTAIPGLKMLVQTLLAAVPLLVNVVSLLLWIFVVFGIIGLQLFDGQLHTRCTIYDDLTGNLTIPLGFEDQTCGGAYMCPNGTNCTSGFDTPNEGYTSFDNFGVTSFNVFTILTLDTWNTRVMQPLVDSMGPLAPTIFFIALVLFGSFFAMQLLVAVLSSKFAQIDGERKAIRRQQRRAKRHARLAAQSLTSVSTTFSLVERLEVKLKERDDDEDMSSLQRCWLSFAIAIVSRTLKSMRWIQKHWRRYDREELARWRRPFWDLVHYRHFTNFVIGMILVNTAAMAIEYYDMPDWYSNALNILNIVLTIGFTIEMILKHIGFGVVNYWRDGFSILDGLIVILSGVEVLLEVVMGSSSSGMSALRTFRILRILRSLRLLMQVKALRKTMVLVIKGFIALKDFMLLLALFIFIFSVMGYQIFAGSPAFTSRSTFDTMWQSCYTTFQILTGDGWVEICMNGMTALGDAASLYFIFWIVIGNWVLLTLFLAILITSFQTTDENKLRTPRGSDMTGFGSESDATSVATTAYTAASTRNGNMLQQRVNERRQDKLSVEMVQSMKAWLTTMEMAECLHQSEVPEYEQLLYERYSSAGDNHDLMLGLGLNRRSANKVGSAFGPDSSSSLRRRSRGSNNQPSARSSSFLVHASAAQPVSPRAYASTRVAADNPSVKAWLTDLMRSSKNLTPPRQNIDASASGPDRSVARAVSINSRESIVPLLLNPGNISSSQMGLRHRSQWRHLSSDGSMHLPDELPRPYMPFLPSGSGSLGHGRESQDRLCGGLLSRPTLFQPLINLDGGSFFDSQSPRVLSQLNRSRSIDSLTTMAMGALKGSFADPSLIHSQSMERALGTASPAGPCSRSPPVLSPIHSSANTRCDIDFVSLQPNASLSIHKEETVHSLHMNTCSLTGPYSQPVTSSSNNSPFPNITCDESVERLLSLDPVLGLSDQLSLTRGGFGSDLVQTGSLQSQNGIDLVQAGSLQSQNGIDLVQAGSLQIQNGIYLVQAGSLQIQNGRSHSLQSHATSQGTAEPVRSSSVSTRPIVVLGDRVTITGREFGTIASRYVNRLFSSSLDAPRVSDVSVHSVEPDNSSAGFDPLQARDRGHIYHDNPLFPSVATDSPPSTSGTQQGANISFPDSHATVHMPVSSSGYMSPQGCSSLASLSLTLEASQNHLGPQVRPRTQLHEATQPQQQEVQQEFVIQKDQSNKSSVDLYENSRAPSSVTHREGEGKGHVYGLLATSPLPERYRVSAPGPIAEGYQVACRELAADGGVCSEERRLSPAGCSSTRLLVKGYQIFSPASITKSSQTRGPSSALMGLRISGPGPLAEGFLNSPVERLSPRLIVETANVAHSGTGPSEKSSCTWPETAQSIGTDGCAVESTHMEKKSLSSSLECRSSLSGETLRGHSETEVQAEVRGRMSELCTVPPQPLGESRELPVKKASLEDALLDPGNKTELEAQEMSMEVCDEDPCDSTPMAPEYPVYLDYSSLYILPPLHPIRVFADRLMNSQWFSNLILVLILISSVLLAIDTPRLDPDSTEASVINIIDLVLTMCFLAEMVLKHVVKGAFMHPESYWRTGWDILDGIIVTLSVIAAFGSSNTAAFRVMRILRALRPLRMIRRWVGMRLVLDTLLRSMPSIANVAFFGLFQFIVFGILGEQLFVGRFAQCNQAAFENGTVIMYKDQCEEGTFLCNPDQGDLCVEAGEEVDRQWSLPFANFDNTGYSIIALFIVTTLDHFMEIAYACMDTTSLDQAPQANNAPYYGLYIVSFVFLGAFFWVNLLVSVIIDHYTKVVAEQGDILASKKAKEIIKVFKFSNSSGDAWKKVPVPHNRYRLMCYRIASHPAFDNFIMCVIMANVVVMAMPYYGQSTKYDDITQILNSGFTGIFVAEAITKMSALRPRLYFSDTWNRVDCLIIVVSIPDILSLFIAALGKSTSITTILRILRIVRMFKLVRRLKGLRTLFNTLISSLPAIFNVSSLFLLVMYIYAIIGINVYGTWDTPFAEDENNFNTIGAALLSLFCIFTNAGWTDMMATASGCDELHYNCAPLSTVGAAAFFISFVFFGTFMMLNLVIAVVLDNFIESAQTEGLLAKSGFVELMRMVVGLKAFVKTMRIKLEHLKLEEESHRRRVIMPARTSTNNHSLKFL